MKKYLLAGAVLALAFGCSKRPAVTDPEAKALIEKAVAAQGGEAKLSQVKAGLWKGRGYMNLAGQKLPLTVETVYQLPDKYKSTMQFELMGKKVGGVQVVDGDKGWMSGQGKTQALEGKMLDLVKEEFYCLNVEMLVPLLREEKYTLTKLPETQVNGRPAVGVKVASKDHKDMELYFDKDTNLPAKTIRPSADPVTMSETTAEVLYSNIKDFDGVKWPGKMVVNQDGKTLIELEITEFKTLDKVNPREFAMPR